MKAYRIVKWWKFEVLKNGKLASAKTKMISLRKSPLIYVRFPIHGHTLNPDYRRMVKRAGDELAAACDGLYKMLVALAGNQVREYRGWILDDRQRPLNPEQVAEILCLSERKVSQIFEVLLDPEVKWIEFLDFPEALHKSWNRNDLSEVPKSGEKGKIKEKKGAPFIEAEAEAEGFSKDKDKGFESETDRNRRGGVREKKGELGREGESRDGGENVQPQAQPAAQPSVSGSGTDSVPASDSEKLSASDSAPVTDSDSVSKAGPRAGPGAGADETEPLTDKDRIFEIIREGKKANLELSQIIHPHNSSDITTISDIYTQLQHRLIAGSPYPLFELSLNTARQCWRADKPIAMFVAAMKKPPFYYVPKKLSVIPGKFSHERR